MPMTKQILERPLRAREWRRHEPARAKALMAGERVFDFLADGGRRGQGGISQPIMADHAFFIGVGDGAAVPVPLMAAKAFCMRGSIEAK